MAVNVKKGSLLDKDGNPMVINQLTLRPVQRQQAGIDTYRTAHKLAEFIANPSRVRLYDLYDEALLDGHLTGVTGKRLRSMRNKRLRYVDAKGEKVDGMDEFIKSKECRFIRKRIYNSLEWGLSGLEFIPGKAVKVKEIPRKHIKPHLKLVTREQHSNDPVDGGNYEQNPFLFVIDNEDDPLGFLLKAVAWIIYKRGVIADWAQYIELFGQPVRIGKYAAYDVETRQALEEALEKAGSSLAIMIPKEAEFEVQDGKTSNGDGKLQEAFVRVCDEQLSILVLGQTETTKSSQSSGYAQSEIHQEQQLEVTQDDMDYELDWLNEPKLQAILKSYGLPIVEGGKFEHEDEANPAKLLDKMKVDEKVAEKVPLDDDYWYETYKLPKPKNYKELKKKQEEAQRAATYPPKPTGKPNPPEDKDLSDSDDGSEDIVTKVREKTERYLKWLSGFFLHAPAAPGPLTTDLEAMYSSRCPGCGGRQTLPDLASDDMSWISDIASQLHNHRLKEGTIPRELYEHTAQRLMQGLFEGMGAVSFDYADPKNELRAYLEHNVYAFSAAKSLSELNHFRSLLVDETGKTRSFEEFRNAVTDAGYLFNKTHLETEYHSAIASAEMAAKWQEMESWELLEYSTVGDDRVRPEHAQLDGFTAPASDPIWGRIYPPNDWNCRCTVIPGVAKNVKPVDKSGLVKKAKIPKYFQRNTGTDKVIFSEDHPHFKAAGAKLKELTAEGNYNMPSVQKLYDENTFPEARKFQTKEEANSWWKDRAGYQRAEFHVKDISGNSIRFDNAFRTHVLEGNKDARQSILGNCEDIVTSPDEVWSYKEGGRLRKIYLKYYKEKPMAVRVEGTDAFTMYEYGDSKGGLNIQSLTRSRRGALLYRKN